MLTPKSTQGTTKLVRVLTEAPVKEKSSKFFKADDCANVKDDPDDPTDALTCSRDWSLWPAVIGRMGLCKYRSISLV